MKQVRNWRQFLPLGLIALIGAFLSILAYLIVADWERQAQDIVFDRSANERIVALRESITSNLEILHSLKSLFLATENVSRGEFRRFVGHDLLRHKTIQALEWIPRVPAKERAAYEAAARRGGLPDFRFTERKTQGVMVPAAPRDLPPVIVPVRSLVPSLSLPLPGPSWVPRSLVPGTCSQGSYGACFARLQSRAEGETEQALFMRFCGDTATAWKSPHYIPLTW